MLKPLIILIALFVCSAYTQTVEISGFIRDENGDAIEGAGITLTLNSDATDISDAQGSYELISNSAGIPSGSGQFGARFEGGLFSIRWASAAAVPTATLYNGVGKKQNPELHFVQGRDVFSINLNNFQAAPGNYILGVSAGRQLEFFRFIHQYAYNQSHYPDFNFPGLNKKSLTLTSPPVDTITVSASGFQTRTLAISQLIQQDLVIVMFAEAGPDTWSVRTSLPELNAEIAVAEVDGIIYVIGGYPSSRETQATVQSYNVYSNTWELVAPLPQPVNHSMAAGYEGHIYHFGGQSTTGGSGNFLDNVYKYDPGADEWTELTPMPTARGAGATAIYDGKIYVAGGRPPQGGDFAAYDVAADSWEELPPIPTERNHLAVGSYNGKIYVVGGRFGANFSSEFTDVTEMYDPETREWTTMTPMPTSRSGINGIFANGCMHIFGGEATGIVFPQHEVYNPVSDTWTSKEDLPLPIHGVTGMAFVDGWIYLPGGGLTTGSSNPTNIMQTFYTEEVCE